MHAVLWMTFALLVVGTVWDLRKREIPDAIPVALLALAVASTALGRSTHGWLPLLLGCGLALAIGMLLFWRGGFGGGDVKLLAALGAVVGPAPLVSLLFYVAIAGGLFAVVALARGKSDLAYAPAITLGFLAFVITRGVW
jgi:prepilin peptidase CpaA